MRPVRGVRTALGAAAFVVALALTASSCVGADQARHNVAGSVVSAIEFAALWPEQDLSAAMRTQAAVDAGGSLWRTNAAATAQRFATDVLGWPGSRVIENESWTLSRGIEIARVWLCGDTGCPAGSAFQQEVILKRLTEAGDSGVWSITDVTSRRILLQSSPFLRIRDPKVRAGARFTAVTVEHGGFPDGIRVVAGSTVEGVCGPIVDASTPTFRFRTVRFQVATRLQSSCGKVSRPPKQTHGYVFVLPELRGARVRPDALFTEPRREHASPIQDLTAIAVRFLPRDAMPSAPAAWLSRDPDTLPSCHGGQLRIGDVRAGQAVPGLGVGIFAEIERRNVAACHAVVDVRLRLFDARGHPIRLPGDRVAHIEGYLPGYVPGRRSLLAVWGLFDWCGRRIHGPVEIRVTGAGQTAGRSSNELAMWCPPGAGARPYLAEVGPTSP